MRLNTSQGRSNKVVRTIKSVTAREVFKRCAGVKKKLWGGGVWSDGYFASTVGKHRDEQVIARYVQGRGNSNPKEYKKIHSANRLALF